MHFEDAETSFISELGSSAGENQTESEVDYPLIDLKTGLKNELIEKTLKDLKRISDKSKNDFRNRPKEASHRVLGQFRSAQFVMSKAINYYFSEQEYVLEKMKRAQLQTLRDLQRIHLNKRKQLRKSYEYHNEEMRRSLARMKEEANFIKQQQDLEEAIRQEKMNINKLIVEQKNLQQENEVKPKKKFKRKPPSPIEKEIIPISERSVESNDPESIPTKINDEPPLIRDLSKSRSFLQTKALEVTKDLSKPRTLERNMDERVVSNVQTLPSIFKHDDFVDQKSKLITEIKDVKTNDKEETKIVEMIKSPNEDIKLPKEINKKPKFKSVKDIMKQRKLKREKEFREVLALPFIAYRRNSEGKIIEMDHPPGIQKFNEPSNKNKYQMRKILDEERNRYQDSIENLAKTTENIIQEDNRRIRLLNAPKLEIQRKPVYESQKIGPEHWMKAFVSSNIPDDIDPSSTEAIIYCRYIRAPLASYSHLPNYLLYHTPL